MHDEIKVHVVKYPDRKNLVMRYLDPMTGKQVPRSTGTNKKREAEKVAAKWEAELQEGRYQKRNRMPWDEFKMAYLVDGTGNLKQKTVDAYSSTLTAFENHCRPKTVAELTTPKVTAFARLLREQKSPKLAVASVARHLRHLRLISRWANRQGYLAEVPLFDMPKRASGARRMKGRPITLEEFERMLSVTPKVLGEADAESWKLLLRGLWASGLRLGEALALRWDSEPDGVSVQLEGRQSVLAFDAEAQKSGKVELVPLAPEAVELLEPIQRSRGFVFKLPTRDIDKVSKRITRIGKAAGVVVDAKSGKAASAHDLRRAFGYRWSRKVMPAELKEIMRHASIETTMTYYVGQNAKATSVAMWRALGNKPSTNGQDDASSAPPVSDVTGYTVTTSARSSVG